MTNSITTQKIKHFYEEQLAKDLEKTRADHLIKGIEAQQEKEKEILKKYQTCPAFSEEIREHFGSFNPQILSSEILHEFYNPESTSF